MGGGPCDDRHRLSGEALSACPEKFLVRRAELGVADDLLEVPGLSLELVVELGEKGIKTLDNLADLASDELVEMLPEKAMTDSEAAAVIMAARAHWFEDEVTEETAEETGAETGSEAASEPETGTGDPADPAKTGTGDPADPAKS